jgi:hypothetical protein
MDFIVRIACAILGVAFAAVGLILIIIGNLSGGGVMTLMAIVLLVLARKFRRFRIKTWAFEIRGTALYSCLVL